MNCAPDAAQRAVLHGLVRCRAGAQLACSTRVPALRCTAKRRCTASGTRRGTLMNELDFSGKRVLVIGGSSGIGNGIAQAFRAKGARVHVCGTRSNASGFPEMKCFRVLPSRSSIAMNCWPSCSPTS